MQSPSITQEKTLFSFVSKVVMGNRVAIGISGTREEQEMWFNFFWNHDATSAEVPQATYGTDGLVFFITSKYRLLKALANAALLKLHTEPELAGKAFLAKAKVVAEQQFVQIQEGNFKNFVAPPSKRAKKTGDCQADVEAAKNQNIEETQEEAQEET